jgi:hypothetical protein
MIVHSLNALLLLVNTDVSAKAEMKIEWIVNCLSGWFNNDFHSRGCLKSVRKGRGRKRSSQNHPPLNSLRSEWIAVKHKKIQWTNRINTHDSSISSLKSWNALCDSFEMITSHKNCRLSIR